MPQQSDPDAPANRGAYAFLGLATLLNVLNFVDRQLLASFSNFIVPELGLTNTQFGLLTGFAFILFYSTMGLFAGALADRVHRPRLVAAGLALWSGLTAVSGAARGFFSLGIARAFIGVGESVLTPASMSMLADRFPRRHLGFVSATYYMGVPIGVGTSLLIAGYLGPAIGWRNCFYALGAIGLVFSLVMLLMPESERRGALSEATPEAASDGIIAPLLEALRAQPALSLTIAGGVATHFILGAAAFDQLWFVQERGFERAEIARLSGWMGVGGGVLGNLLGGLGADWWQRNRKTGRPFFLGLVLLVAVPINVAFRLVPPDSFWFYLGLFAGAMQLGVLYGPTFATVQDLAPAKIRATVVAFFILALNLVGIGFGITVGGILIDTLASQGVSEPYTWTLLCFSLLSALSIPCFLAAGRKLAR